MNKLSPVDYERVVEALAPTEPQQYSVTTVNLFSDVVTKGAQLALKPDITFKARVRPGSTISDQTLYIEGIARIEELCLHPIEISDNYSKVYVDLAGTLPDGESIRLLNGTVVTKLGLLLKATNLKKKGGEDPETYVLLQKAIPQGKSIWLTNGRIITNEGNLAQSKGEIGAMANEPEQRHWLQEIYFKPDDPNAYVELGISLPPGQGIKLLNGITVTEQDLYLKAISLDPKYFLSYKHLAATLLHEGSIQLLDGTTVTKGGLLVKAMDLKSGNEDLETYVLLQKAISKGKKVRLANGQIVTGSYPELNLKNAPLPKSERSSH